MIFLKKMIFFWNLFFFFIRVFCIILLKWSANFLLALLILTLYSLLLILYWGYSCWPLKLGFQIEDSTFLSTMVILSTIFSIVLIKVSSLPSDEVGGFCLMVTLFSDLIFYHLIIRLNLTLIAFLYIYSRVDEFLSLNWYAISR